MKMNFNKPPIFFFSLFNYTEYKSLGVNVKMAFCQRSKDEFFSPTFFSTPKGKIQSHQLPMGYPAFG